jgi:osmotically-inducible protein OsmY
LLTGQVETWLQREAAERAAESAPGVVRVDNRIAVEPSGDIGADLANEIC